MMQKILVTDDIDESALHVLNAYYKVEFELLDAETLLKRIKDYVALVVRSRTKVTKDVIENASILKVIGRAGIGVDNIDVDTATKHGIAVVNAPGASTIAVAELTICYLLNLSRDLISAHTSLKSKKWEKKKFMGIELYGKTLGIIGCGRIGTEVAKRAKSFGMKCIGYDPYLSTDIKQKIGIDIVELDKLLTESDFITIHTPLTSETRNLIDTAEIAKMKKDVCIINCARGGIVNENALFKALKERRIKAAAIDVFENEPPFDSPLLGLENLIVTPHIGASTIEAQFRAGKVIAEQVLKVLKGEKPDFIVNPQVLHKM